MAENAFGKCKVSGIEVVHKGNWINTHLIKYSDPNGVKREWEAVGYVNKNPDKSVPDSVQVIALLKRNLHHNCIVLVQQFRPPVGCFSIEFPAGLIDAKDENVGDAALRELHEETGYTGVVTDGEYLEHPVSLDPGCETSTITTVHVTIDGDDPKNIDCVQHLDEAEFIKVLLVPVRELLTRLNQFMIDKKEKYIIDSRLYAFAIGLHMGTTSNFKDKPVNAI